MADIGHNETEEVLEEVEQELNAIYKAVNVAMKVTLLSVLAKIGTGETQAERYANANKYNRLGVLVGSIASEIVKGNKEAVTVSNTALIKTYGINYTYTTYALEKAINNVGLINLLSDKAIKKLVEDNLSPFTLLAMDNIVDRNAIERELTTQLVNGIVNGESNQKIARRVTTVIEKNASDALRIARTEVTRVQSSARQDMYDTAKEKYGIKLKKMWVATNDSRTRDSHAMADGQTVDSDKEFTVSGYKTMEPGLFGVASMDINCRCTTVPIQDDIISSDIGYDEWREKRGVA